MKSTTCWHPKSPLRKGGVERARLKFKNYFPDPEVDMDFTSKKLEYLWLIIHIHAHFNTPLKSSVIFECFTIVRILYGKSIQYTSEILNYNIAAFYFANFLTWR